MRQINTLVIEQFGIKYQCVFNKMYLSMVKDCLSFVNKKDDFIKADITHSVYVNWI